jgi:hypothetical protein
MVPDPLSSGTAAPAWQAPVVEGPAPETQVAKDMVRRSLPFLPLLLLLGASIGGVDGAVSAAYAVVIVLANLALSAALLAWAARISLGLLMGVALFGFLLRLGLIFLAVLAFADAPWMDFWALGVVLIVTHLGLLFWEMRYVSVSLAHPGLRPPTRPTATPAGARRPR